MSHLNIKYSALILVILALGFSLIFLFTVSPEELKVIFPFVAIVNIALCFLMWLWAQDGVAPFFDLGAFTIAITAIYGAYPLLMYYLSGLKWTAFSDQRLLALNATPDHIGQFGTWLAVYLLFFGITYCFFRGKGLGVGELPEINIDRQTIYSILLLCGSLLLFTFGVEVSYQINFNVNHKELAGGDFFERYMSLPLLVRQLLHHFAGILTILKFALIVVCMRYWGLLWVRALLIAWLGFETLSLVINMGSRSTLVFMFISVLLAYHRLVHPFKASVLAASGFFLLLGAIVYGIARNFLQNSVAIDTTQIFSAASEFQILVGTAYHLLYLKVQGVLTEIPWQVYFADVLMLIPQQLLPITKIDPSTWYLDVTGAASHRFGFMFGLLSQGVIGLGIIEMALRGFLLGALFAFIHRAYIRNATSFWFTLFYLWMIVISYYTYRASTFYFLVFIVYRFLPALVFTVIVKKVFFPAPDVSAARGSASQVSGKAILNRPL